MRIARNDQISSGRERAREHVIIVRVRRDWLNLRRRDRLREHRIAGDQALGIQPRDGDTVCEFAPGQHIFKFK